MSDGDAIIFAGRTLAALETLAASYDLAEGTYNYTEAFEDADLGDPDLDPGRVVWQEAT